MTPATTTCSECGADTTTVACFDHPAAPTVTASPNGQPPAPPHIADEGPAPTAEPGLADVANATRFLEAHGHRFRYFAAARQWLVYERGVWSEDPDRVQARAAAELVARDLMRDAADEPDPDRAKEKLKLAARAMTSGRLAAMLEVAEPHIAVGVDDLDAHPWLLNTASGVVDLKTGALSDHDPELLLTRQTRAAYRPGATAPTWQRFLERILPDEEVRRFVQRLVGSTLVGIQRDHVLPILFGVGGNGKGTLVDAINFTLGSYALKVDVAMLTGRGAERASPTPELVQLRGVRFAFADEPEAGARLRESHVKALTGGGTVVARPMYAPPIEFTATHTLALVTNHRPAVQGGDEGIWRRLLLVLFAVLIRGNELDPDLPTKLTAEADGILAWAVEGCLAYCKDGLEPPPSVRADTEAYRAEQDHMTAFIEDECVVSAAVRAQVSQLRSAYEQWCGQAGASPLSATAFGTKLTDRGFAPVKSNGHRYRSGLALRAEP